MTSYSYIVLRYVHDFAAGEAVNVGVLVYAPQDRFVKFQGIHRTHALSQLFRGFNRDEFLRFLARLESATNRFQESLKQEQLGLFEIKSQLSDAGALARWLLPDNELSFQFGETRGGITRDVAKTAATVFERMITRQRPAEKEYKRRDDEEVWDVFQTAFKEHNILKILKPHTIQVPGFETPISFQRAYKNEKWHAVEAMSFDYADPRSIREKAMLWYGYGAALKEAADFSQLYLLLGAPTDREQRKDFLGAKNWLAKMPIRPQLIEENQAKDFAASLASTIEKEGVDLEVKDERMTAVGK